MPWTSAHTKWLKPTNTYLKTVNGKHIPIWEFKHEKDEAILTAWAKHFRNHYCLDTQIDDLRSGTGYDRSTYLKEIIFPDSNSNLGPPVKAGDFGEILVADYLQYILNYWVPRTRYCGKTVRDESTKGGDIIGFKLFGNGQPTSKDELIMFEAKAQFSEKKAEPKLQKAVDDSAKDKVRVAESLNAMKRYLLLAQKREDAKKVERFQGRVDYPCKEIYGAAALFTDKAFDSTVISQTNTSQHPAAAGLQLIVIRGKDMMGLVNELYNRAANEA